MPSLDFTAFEHVGALVIVLDTADTVVYWNGACSELTGRQLDEARGKRLGALLRPPEEATRIASMLKELRTEQRSARFESTWLLDTGERRTIAFASSIVVDTDTSGQVLVLTGVDITEIDIGPNSVVARLGVLLDQAPDGIFVADLEGRCTSVNDAGCGLLGRPREEIVGASLTDFVPPDEVGRVWQIREQLLKGGVELTEGNVRKKDGTHVPVEVSTKILPDGRWQSLVRDISERKRLERSLVESHQELSQAQSVAKIGSWRLDLQRDELLWSEETHRIFQTPPGTPMTYEAFLARVHPEDRAYVDHKWRAALRGEPYDIEHRIVVADGVKWVREQADFEFDQSGALCRGVGVVHDITAQKKASEEQRLWQERLNAIVSISAEAIISVDDEQQIVLFNEGAEKIFGWSPDEMVGKPLDLLIPEQFRDIHRKRVQTFGEEVTCSRGMGEHRPAIFGLRKSGEEFPAEAAISKVEVAGRKFFTVTLRDITDRRAVERERERLLAEIDAERSSLRAMLGIVPVGILFFQPDNRVFFNRRTEELLGKTLSPEGGNAQYAAHILSPGGSPVPQDQLASTRVLRNGESVVGVEYLIERPDGTRIPVLASGAPLRDPDGRVVGGIVVFQDLSERMRAEEALRVSEQRLKVSLSAAPVVVWNQDPELRYTWIHNPRDPFTSEHVLGKSDFELLPRVDAEQLTTIKRGVLESGIGARDVVRTTVGAKAHYYDLIVEPLRDSRGGIVGITCASWDVTDRHRNEQEQRFLAQLTAVLMSAIPDYETTLAELSRLAVRELADWVIIEIVDAGKAQRLKAAYSEPTNARLAEELERFHLGRQRPALMFESLHARQTMLVTDATSLDLESMAENTEHLRLLRALDIQSLIAVPLIARGHLIGALALISSRASHRYDQRDLRLAEELARVAAVAVENAQLYQSTQRAIAARDEVLGIVAHDLRNPLNTVLLQSQQLRRPGPETERRNQRPVDGIRRAALLMNRLIQDMLDVASLEAGSVAIERSATAARNVLDEALDRHCDAASGAGLQVRLDIAEHLPDVLVDRDRILQVFDNLIGNSIKFTAPGGTIVIGAAATAGDVLCWVADTGPGIPEEHLAHLFDRFWRASKTDRRGAGLGLTIVKKIIDAHGGRIWVDSQLGRGTTFYFTMPIVSSAEVRAPESR